MAGYQHRVVEEQVELKLRFQRKAGELLKTVHPNGRHPLRCHARRCYWPPIVWNDHQESPSRSRGRWEMKNAIKVVVSVIALLMLALSLAGCPGKGSRVGFGIHFGTNL